MKPVLLALFALVVFAAPAFAQIPVPSGLPVVEATGEPIPEPGQTLVTTWQSGGLVHTVTTRVPAGADEDALRERIRRHARTVQLLREIYPPEPDEHR